MPPLDFSHSQPIEQAIGHAAPATPDCSFAREIHTQLSASIAQPMTGAESLMATPGMPPVPGAEQAVSPLIQMIMRMPGHIGLATSFFEALGNFFLPQADMLSLFDPSHFGLHIDLSSAITADHGTIDFSLLPNDAPILDHLGGLDMGSHPLAMASDKLNLSLGGHSQFVADNGTTSLSFNQYNVSGSASLAKPQFEGAGGLVSGPNVSDNFNADNLAPNNRLFSDGAAISSASSNHMMIAGGNASASVPALSQPSASGLNSASISTQPVASASGSGTGMIDNVSAQGSSDNNVSYNVFEKLTGNRDLLAANNAGDSYHPTIGTIQPEASMDTGSHATAGGDNFGGLKAKSMSLDGAKVDLKPDHAKLEQAAASHPAHKIEHAAQKIEHVAPKMEAMQKPVDHIVNDAPKPTAHPVSHSAPVHHTADKVSIAAAHGPSAHHAVEIKHPVHHVAQPAKQFDPGQIVQPEQPQAPIGAQTEAVEKAAAVDAQNQFGQPVNGDANAADPSQAGQTDAAANGEQPTTDANGQPLEQQAAPETTYTIRSGDCLWNIAKDQLGDATKWSDIYKMNADVLGSNPSLIHPGVQIHMPGAEGAVTGNIAHYTVKAGDNLWNIAKDHMGDATKWGDIYKANQDIIGSNPSLIQPGQELTFNTGAPDPAGAQYSASAAGAGATPDPSGGHLAQAPAAHGHPGAPDAGAQGGDVSQQISQNPEGIQSYGAPPSPELNTASMQHSASDLNFSAAPMDHNFQAPHAPVNAAKVMPVEAQPDSIIPPAHAADLSTVNAASHEVASGVQSVVQSQKVTTSMGADLLSALSKRK